MKITRKDLKNLIGEQMQVMKENKKEKKEPSGGYKLHTPTDIKTDSYVNPERNQEIMIDILDKILEQMKALVYYSTETRGAAASAEVPVGAGFIGEEKENV